MDNQKYNLKDYSCPDRLGHIGDMIRAARKYRKLTQSRLAGLSGLSPKMISLVECGSRGISWCAFQRILAGLKFSVTFYPTEMKPLPQNLAFVLNELIPNLRELLDVLEKIKGVQKQ